ncbi:hypothetical protein K438DRAFT_1765462 [Mycena galopus ATCC 62051]|nr:hypothetical protein K438DRAFT_1765462 [Mycena galopus ATCC 62051]
MSTPPQKGPGAYSPAFESVAVRLHKLPRPPTPPRSTCHDASHAPCTKGKPEKEHRRGELHQARMVMEVESKERSGPVGLTNTTIGRLIRRLSARLLPSWRSSFVLELRRFCTVLPERNLQPPVTAISSVPASALEAYCSTKYFIQNHSICPQLPPPYVPNRPPGAPNDIMPFLHAFHRGGGGGGGRALILLGRTHGATWDGML